MPELRTVIVTYNNAATIEDCLAALHAATEKISAHVSVVDNASADDTVERIESAFPQVETICLSGNIGFGPANNVALRHCEEQFALLLNPDTRIDAGAMETMLQTLRQQPELAMVGAAMRYEDGFPQVSFGPFPGLLADARQRKLVRGCQQRKKWARRALEAELRERFQPQWVSASCALARTEALREVGFFDTDFFLYLEDVDLCRRLGHAGWSVAVEPEAGCVHIEGASQQGGAVTTGHFRRSRLLYANKHCGRLSFEIYRLLRARNIDLRYDPDKRYHKRTSH